MISLSKRTLLFLFERTLGVAETLGVDFFAKMELRPYWLRARFLRLHSDWLMSMDFLISLESKLFWV